ncbi:TonB-dependent receptor [Pseudanabaena sp. 'Roaring Creek']|uniref:TonB-dependent receptor n=1 Tax=Pseudanabaena sp. 'Roaring Creek' TaxID=1681830 RepID=UPI000AEC2462|nr:TonB-dependent receptor [Pseudanabaena sp. 'Roaring Creek']
MKSISIPLGKLGIVVLPQILLLLMSATVKAELIADLPTKDLDINHQESLTDKNKIDVKANAKADVKTDAKTDANIASPLDKQVQAIPNRTDAVPLQTANPNRLDSKTSSSLNGKVADTAVPAEQVLPRIVILSPTVGTVLDVPAATVTIQMPANTKIELVVNGQSVNPNLIGRSELDETNKLVTQTWYGVPLQPGDNQIVVKEAGTGSVASSMSLKVRGKPVKLVVSTLESRVPADGRSNVTIEGQLVDADGNRSNWDDLVTLEASDGELIGTDASPEQPGFQVRAKQGRFTAQLRSSLKTGTVTIRASNAKMEAFTQVLFETDLRPSLVTGVIDLRFGARGTDFYRSLRDFLPTDLNNNTQVDLYGAVFGTGRIGEWLFTGAYNSNRSLNQDCAGNRSLSGTAQYCDSQYPVYGDSSTSTKTTPSYDSLYLRFERNSPVKGASTDYFMWGNFTTDEFTSRSQQFSGISRQLQGFKGNFNIGDVQITGFYSNVGKSFQRDTIAPNGTSGTYFLSKRLLIEGSENVFVELVDFFSAGTVISSQSLTRGKDYDINYDNGSLLFRQPLLQTEIGDSGQLLRRQIVVTYQNEQVGGDSSIYGGQLRYHLNRSQNQPSWIGANYFKESLGIRNFILYGANALISFGEKTQLIAEYARSQNDSELYGYITGTALRFELNSELSSDIIGKLYYRKAETGFANNATTSFVPGQTKYGAELNAKVSPTTIFKFTYDQEENLGVAPRPLTSLTDLLNVGQQATPGSAVDNSLRTISLGLQQNLGSSLLNLDLLFRDRQDRISPSTLSGNSTQLRSRLSVPIADNVKLTAQNEVSLSSSSDAVIPDRSVLALDWTIFQGLTARLGQQWFHSGPLAGNSITSADLLGEYKLGTDTTFTGRYSLVGGANNATTTQGSLGLNQRWQVLPGVRLNFGYEHIFGSFGTTTTTGTSFLQPFAVGQSSSSLTLQNGDSYNIGFEYTDNPDFKASAKFENRSNSSSSNTVVTASALGKLSPALTMLFNYQQSSAANQSIVGLGTISSLKVGLAYRDPNDDKFNLLLRYEYRQNPSIVPDSLLLGSGTGYNDYTLALEGIYAPNWQWEFYGKLALRNSTTNVASDFTAVSATNLTQFRVTYRAGYNVELVGETRFLNQPTANYSEMGLVGEVGYYLTPNLRLAAGYSSGAVNADRDFSGTRSAGGLYAGITVKLNELFDGFGLQKTPPRQQQEPIDPQTPVATASPQAPKVAAVATPPTPQVISLNVARSLTFTENRQGNNAELAISDIAILENLVAILREYNDLSLDIRGYIGSLAEMNSGDNLAAKRMMATRKYLLDRGVANSQMTLRSLGGVPINSTELIGSASNTDVKATPVSFAISGKADVFNAIATRLQTMASNSPTAEFLQALLPNASPILQASASPSDSASGKVPNVSVAVNVGNDGKIADLSYATLDRTIERLNANPNLLFEIQSNSVLSASAGQDLGALKALAVRSYLLDKGVSSDRILLSARSVNADSKDISQVYISLSQDDGNSNIASVPTAPAATAQAPIAQAAGKSPSLAVSTNATLPLSLFLEADRRVSDWLERTVADPQLNPQFNPAITNSIQISNLGFAPLLSQLPALTDSLLAIALPENPARSAVSRNILLSYAVESSPTQLLSKLIGNENASANFSNNNESKGSEPVASSADRRLATAFNFLLTNKGDTTTAFLRAIGLSPTEKSGFAIDPERLSNLKN